MNYVPIKTGRGETSVKVNRGEFLFGRFKAEEELFIDGSTIYKIMKRLEKIGNISIKSNSHYSIVSICNYEQYQDDEDIEVTSNEQASNNQVTTKSQASNTTKKEKNVNKEEVIKFYELEKQNAGEKYKDKYYEFVNYLFGKNEMNEEITEALKLKKQVSYKQFNILLSKVSDANNMIGSRKIIILDMLKSMYNKPKLIKDNKCLYSTLDSWVNRGIRNLVK